MQRRGLLLEEQRRIVAYLDGLCPGGLLRDRQATLVPGASAGEVNALRELQVKSGEELRPFVRRTLMPSIFDKAFKGEL